MRALEFSLIFIVFPLIIFILKVPSIGFLVLWFFVAIMGIYLTKQPNFDWREEWNFAAVKWGNLKPILILLSIAIVGMIITISILRPEFRFRLLKEKPLLLLMISVIYPILSVLPQEILYRTYFFKRYKPLFGQHVIIASALSFGFVHFIFYNMVAPILSTVGGLFFAYHYHKYRSLALTSLEHALYGIAIFGTGLGVYFFQGGQALLQQ